MTKTKSTKRALLMSALAILACVSMFVGSTFAWFTDSVTSATNKIVAGNLDVELYHTNGTDADEKVTGTTPLFDEVALWEPGAMVWEKLTVKNAGSLALKYTLSVNITGATTVNGKSLADVLKVAVMNEQPTRENIKTAETRDLSTFALNTGKSLAAKTGVDTFYVAIYWEPRENDNDYNVADGALYANLGITLTAYQDTVESDSFNKYYDEAANAVEVSTYNDLQDVLSNGGYAKLNADIDAASEANKTFVVAEGADVVIDLNGHTLTNKDGGSNNWDAIYVSRGATLTLNDSAGGGEIVSSCYGVNVTPNATFIMNGGKISVSGNSAFDIGVLVWNGNFVMNGGTIDARVGVCTSNYYKDSDSTLPVNSITIANAAVINSSANIDVCIFGASDAELTLKDGTKVNSTEDCCL